MNTQLDMVKVKDELYQWLLDWEAKNANGCNFVVGISGGKDSTVVATLLCAVFGKERVIGVQMPNGTQSDIDVSTSVIQTLGIRSIEINIGDAFQSITGQIDNTSQQTIYNLPPRLHMATLYAVAQSNNGRVIGTSNLSEIYIGWETRWGDSVADCEPIADLTCSEVIELGHILNVPNRFLMKAPSDGLTGKTDEDNFGFTYQELDFYIRDNAIAFAKLNSETIRRIGDMHRKNLFKQSPIPTFRLHNSAYNFYNHM